MHLSISENQLSQFAALFEPHGEGFAYFGDSARGGLPVSAQERDDYIAQYAKVLRTGERVTVGWALCASVGLVFCEMRMHWLMQDWQRGMALLAPLPWILWTWWRFKQGIVHRIAHRLPISPPRTYAAGVWSRISAFPRSLPLLMIAIGTLLLVQQLRYGLMAVDLVGDVTGVGIIIFGLWTLWVKSSHQRQAKPHSPT
jgi:hypothetical protein